MAFFLSSNEIDFLLKSLKEGLRTDGRNLIDHRSIEVNFGKDPGELQLALGQTLILTRVSGEILPPKEERPSEGFLKFKVDLSVLNEDKQNMAFIPKEYSNEISKLLERVLKGSKALDPESLCIISGKAVWSISIEVVLINNAGNLIDACYFGALLGLLNYRKPCIKIENENSVKMIEATEKAPQALSITHIPISFTYGFFNEANQVIADPSDLEEEIMEGRITIVMNIYKDICLIHKPGGAPLDPLILDQLIAATELKVSQITQLLREFITNCDKYSIYQPIQKEAKLMFDWKSPQKTDLIDIEELKQTIQT